MNLQQTIDELEQKAAEYTQAASSLRALLPYENASGASGSEASVSTAGAKAQSRTRGGAKKGAKGKAASPKVAGQQQGQRESTSSETRAKIAAAAKTRHGKSQPG